MSMKIQMQKTKFVLTAFLAAALVLPPSVGAQRMPHSTVKPAKPAAGASINGGAQRSAGRGNIDNRGRDVNINIDRDVNVRHNTVVRPGRRPYARPPHVYGGRRYYCHAPYFYHPFRPFHWGPAWHPWGFFVAVLATTAIVVSVSNQQYHYDQGVYYAPTSGGYKVVPAPVGATVSTLPSGSETVVVDGTTYYYYGGTYYQKTSSYTVVAPTAGAVVEKLPEGGEEVKIGDITYVKVGETYYQPIQQDGKNMYEVVQIEEDK
jgi:hypothetical protein